MPKPARPLRISDEPVKSLKPAPYNPRDISEAAFKGLKESIKKFGFVDPLVMNTKTGLLVGGHQRLKAAQALGLKTVPVVHVSLSPTEEKALNITLNNPRISGHYTEALQELLDELSTDLGDEMALLKLDDLVIPDSWGSGTEKVDETDENLDGLTAKIIIRCPQVSAQELRAYLERKLGESGIEGVQLS